jgi:hypothetical protein
MRRLRVHTALLLVSGWLALACGGPDTLADGLPPGALLSARRADLVRLLEHFSALEGTPLASRAGALARALPDCDELEARHPRGDLAALLADLRCRTPEAGLEALHRQRGGDALAVAWPLDGEMRLHGRLALAADGDAHVTLDLPRAAVDASRALLLPGERTAGPGVLSAEESLLHARVRPLSGLDLAALVPDGSQGDQLFRLKSRLFTGSVLDGTWEVAVYLPEEGRQMPRAALALGFASRAAALLAMDAFLDDLEATWPLRRSEFSPDGRPGACFLELRILPEFAPCYVATQHALVVGYSPASVLHALDGAPAPQIDAAGDLRVDLARFPEADARLARARGRTQTVGLPAWPWRLLRARGQSRAGSVELRVDLLGEAGA